MQFKLTNKDKLKNMVASDWLKHIDLPINVMHDNQ